MLRLFSDALQPAAVAAGLGGGVLEGSGGGVSEGPQQRVLALARALSETVFPSCGTVFSEEEAGCAALVAGGIVGSVAQLSEVCSSVV